MQKKIIITAFIIGSIIAAYFYYLDEYVTLTEIRHFLREAVLYYRDNPVTTIVVYSLLFIITTVLSIPATAVLTLIAGAMFGLVPGVLLVLFSATVGAVLSFLLARHFLGTRFQQKYKCQLDKINQGIEDEGNYYHFSLRVMPVLPFCVINILMGLTKMRLWNYTLITLAGIATWVIIYVYAGTMLRRIRSFEDIVSYEMAIAMILLGTFPIIMKKILSYIERRKIRA